MNEVRLAVVGHPLIAVHEYTEKLNPENFFTHIHEIHELYCFVGGTAQIFLEGQIYTPKPGDIFLFKRGEAHNIIPQSTVAYERICVNFSEEALLECEKAELEAFLNDTSVTGKHYPAALRWDNRWRNYLDRMCHADTPEEARLYLTVMLTELRKNPNYSSNKGFVRDVTADVLDYINAHLTEPLNLDHICAKFFLSKSYLNQKFKTLTNTTVWDYITTKRLLLAKQLLQNGELPSRAATRCGFEEYVTFYRAYKKKFGHSPREDCLKPL